MTRADEIIEQLKKLTQELFEITSPTVDELHFAEETVMHDSFVSPPDTLSCMENYFVHKLNLTIIVLDNRELELEELEDWAKNQS